MFRIVVDCDLAGISKIQNGWRIKIARNRRNAWSWREGDEVVQLADDKDEILIILKKDKFDQLVKNGVIKIV